MASANDGAGEILSSQLPVTFSRSSSLATPAGQSTAMSDPDVDDDRASSSSSPPTHPAFFSPKRSATKQQGDTPSSAGKENICPAVRGLNPVSAPFSPLCSPLAVLKAQKPSSHKVGGAEARAGTPDVVMDKDELTPAGGRGEDCDDGKRGNETRRTLKDVDMNIAAALSSEKADGGSASEVDATPKDSSSKKSKRKNKKNHDADGINGDHKDQSQVPPESTSYADAAKADPVDVEKREAQPPSEQENAHAPASDGEKTHSMPASSKSFAEALKQPAVQDARPAEKRDSLASTAVGYPELHSDSDDEDEKERRRDRQNASQVLSMRWAPLRVPFKRRLQTLAVLFHCLCMGISLSIFFFCCAIVPLWPIIIIYLIYLLFATDGVDGKLRSRREWVRRLPIWTYFAEYFPAKLHKTHDLIPTRKYILGYHPHGIISHGAWAAFATDALGFSEKFPGITNSLLTLDSNFRLPLYREYVLSMGVQSVSKESITNLLTRGGPNKEGMGRAVTVVIGGARESLEAQPNTMHLIVKERKGFVKLALQTGADLVPVIAFGENDLYDQLDPHKHPWLHNMQRYFLKVWKFTVPLLHGRGIFNYDVGLMPYRRPMNIVVGKPIPVFQTSTPDNAEVSRLHDLYIEELQKIWDRYKDEFSPHRREEMQFMS